MAEEITVLQNWVVGKFILPFLLIFFIVFAILERTKIFGEGKKQLNALTAFVIGLIFASAVYPKLVVGNIILFLTVAIVCVFVIMLLWGFVFGDDKKMEIPKYLIWGLGGVVTIAFIWAVLWATGWDNNVMGFLSGSGTGQTIATSIAFLVVMGVALALVLKGSGGK